MLDKALMFVDASLRFYGNGLAATFNHKDELAPDTKVAIANMSSNQENEDYLEGRNKRIRHALTNSKKYGEYREMLNMEGDVGDSGLALKVYANGLTAAAAFTPAVLVITALSYAFGK